MEKVKKMINVCAALAFLITAAYLLLGFGVLEAGNINTEEAPEFMTYIAAAGYLLGGLLIFTKKRWLWIVGAVINLMVMAIFFSGYADRADVLTSSAGLITKILQVLLEICLVYLIIIYKRVKPA